ncbi:MAG TPA: RDD family protein [Vicinamibacteria bacterium]
MRDADLQQKRLVAAAVDVGIAIALWAVFMLVSMVLGLGSSFASGDSGLATGAAVFLPRIVGFVGALVSLGYILGRDVLAGDRSFGKKLQKIRVLGPGGQPVTFVDSAKRNAIFAIGSVLTFLSATLQLVPCLGDAVACLLFPLWLGGALLGLVAVVLELVKITQEPEGVRMGDQFAQTRVVA